MSSNSQSDQNFSILPERTAFHNVFDILLEFSDYDVRVGPLQEFEKPQLFTVLQTLESIREKYQNKMLGIKSSPTDNDKESTEKISLGDTCVERVAHLTPEVTKISRVFPISQSLLTYFWKKKSVTEYPTSSSLVQSFELSKNKIHTAEQSLFKTEIQYSNSSRHNDQLHYLPSERVPKNYRQSNEGKKTAVNHETNMYKNNNKLKSTLKISSVAGQFKKLDITSNQPSSSHEYACNNKKNEELRKCTTMYVEKNAHINLKTITKPKISPVSPSLLSLYWRKESVRNIYNANGNSSDTTKKLKCDKIPECFKEKTKYSTSYLHKKLSKLSKKNKISNQQTIETNCEPLPNSVMDSSGHDINMQPLQSESASKNGHGETNINVCDNSDSYLTYKELLSLASLNKYSKSSTLNATSKVLPLFRQIKKLKKSPSKINQQTRFTKNSKDKKVLKKERVKTIRQKSVLSITPKIKREKKQFKKVKKFMSMSQNYDLDNNILFDFSEKKSFNENDLSHVKTSTGKSEKFNYSHEKINLSTTSPKYELDQNKLLDINEKKSLNKNYLSHAQTTGKPKNINKLNKKNILSSTAPKYELDQNVLLDVNEKKSVNKNDLSQGQTTGETKKLDKLKNIIILSSTAPKYELDHDVLHDIDKNYVNKNDLSQVQTKTEKLENLKKLHEKKILSPTAPKYEFNQNVLLDINENSVTNNDLSQVQTKTEKLENLKKLHEKNILSPTAPKYEFNQNVLLDINENSVTNNDLSQVLTKTDKLENPKKLHEKKNFSPTSLKYEFNQNVLLDINENSVSNNDLSQVQANLKILQKKIVFSSTSPKCELNEKIKKHILLHVETKTGKSKSEMQPAPKLSQPVVKLTYSCDKATETHAKIESSSTAPNNTVKISKLNRPSATVLNVPQEKFQKYSLCILPHKIAKEKEKSQSEAEKLGKQKVFSELEQNTTDTSCKSQERFQCSKDFLSLNWTKKMTNNILNEVEENLSIDTILIDPTDETPEQSNKMKEITEYSTALAQAQSHVFDMNFSITKQTSSENEIDFNQLAKNWFNSLGSDEVLGNCSNSESVCEPDQRSFSLKRAPYKDSLVHAKVDAIGNSYREPKKIKVTDPTPSKLPISTLNTLKIQRQSSASICKASDEFLKVFTELNNCLESTSSLATTTTTPPEFQTIPPTQQHSIKSQHITDHTEPSSNKKCSKKIKRPYNRRLPVKKTVSENLINPSSRLAYIRSRERTNERIIYEKCILDNEPVYLPIGYMPNELRTPCSELNTSRPNNGMDFSIINLSQYNKTWQGERNVTKFRQPSDNYFHRNGADLTVSNFNIGFHKPKVARFHNSPPRDIFCNPFTRSQDYSNNEMISSSLANAALDLSMSSFRERSTAEWPLSETMQPLTVSFNENLTEYSLANTSMSYRMPKMHRFHNVPQENMLHSKSSHPDSCPFYPSERGVFDKTVIENTKSPTSINFVGDLTDTTNSENIPKKTIHNSSIFSFCVPHPDTNIEKTTFSQWDPSEYNKSGSKTENFFTNPLSYLHEFNFAESNIEFSIKGKNAITENMTSTNILPFELTPQGVHVEPTGAHVSEGIKILQNIPVSMDFSSLNLQYFELGKDA